MAVPLCTPETDQLAKEYFKRKASTAVRMGICVSCKSKVKLLDFTKAGRGDDYQEYKQDGLCLACIQELDAPFNN